MDLVQKMTKEAVHWNRDERVLELFQMPHEVISQNMAILRANLDERVQSGNFEQRQDGVFAASNVEVSEYVLMDTSTGPIVLDEGAKVGAYTLLRGPIYLGKKCRILEHAAIKDRVSIGHTTKIGEKLKRRWSSRSPISNTTDSLVTAISEAGST